MSSVPTPFPVVPIPFPIPVVRPILPDEQKRVLLLKRTGGPHGGDWCLPGGKIDYGKTLEEVIRDELKQETDLDLKSFHFFFIQDSLPAQTGDTHYLNLYFKCRWNGSVTLNYESSAHIW